MPFLKLNNCSIDGPPRQQAQDREEANCQVRSLRIRPPHACQGNFFFLIISCLCLLSNTGLGWLKDFGDFFFSKPNRQTPIPSPNQDNQSTTTTIILNPQNIFSPLFQPSSPNRQLRIINPLSFFNTPNLLCPPIP